MQPCRPAVIARLRGSASDACDELESKAFERQRGARVCGSELAGDPPAQVRRRRCIDTPKLDQEAAEELCTVVVRGPNDENLTAGRSEHAGVRGSGRYGSEAATVEGRTRPAEALAHGTFEDDSKVAARRVDHAVPERGREEKPVQLERAERGAGHAPPVVRRLGHRDHYLLRRGSGGLR